MLGPATRADTEPHPELPALTRAQREVDARLLELCMALEPESLSQIVQVNRGSRMQQDRRDDILSNLFQHQTHHRPGPRHAVGHTCHAAAGCCEFVVADDAGARAEDIVGFGWAEADLMR